MNDTRSSRKSAKRRGPVGVRAVLKGLKTPEGELAFRGATVIHRDDGRLAGRVTLQDGRYRYLYGKNEAEIVDRARDLALGIANEPEDPGKGITVGQWTDRWLESCSGLRTKTTAYYRTYLNHIPTDLKAKRLADLTKADLLALYRSKQGALSPRSVVHLHVVLSTSLQAAEADLGIRNVARMIHKNQKPKAEKREMTVLDDAEAARFIGAAKSEPLHALFVLAVTTGLRQGELLGLRWSDIDFGRKELRVSCSLQGTRRDNLMLGSPKTQSGRRAIPLGSLAIEALLEHKTRQDCQRELVASKWVRPSEVERSHTNLVFCTEFGDYLLPGTVNAAFHRVVKSAKVNGRGLRFHDLRHTAITAWIHDPAIGPKNVSAMAGHESISTTFDIYGHVITASQRVGADNRDERLRELLATDN